jgi:3',5'-cyclic AMP phosphodiesterase CpdA
MRTLVHLSDLHFGRIDSSLLAPLRDAVLAARPDLIAISGDFTQRARRSEFAAARRFVESLGQRVLVVPGNHDVPLWNLPARFLTPFTRYQAYISPALEPEHVDDEIIAVGVNTARSLAWGEGRISARQVDRIVARLAAAPTSLIRIIVTHHPFDLPPGVHERRLLGRARMAMARLAAADADLFLSGHLHLSHASHSAERYRIEGHSALIVQAGTISTRGRGEQPSFNVLNIQRPDIELSRFVWEPSAGRFTAFAAGRYRHTQAGWIAPDASDRTVLDR